MGVLLRFRGRDYIDADAAFIRELIARHPGLSRRRLSAELAQAWGWEQPNGEPRDMVARSLMLALHRAGHIELPVKRKSPPNNAIRHRQAPQNLLLSWEPLPGPLAALKPLEIQQVRRSTHERLFDSFIQTHHYLGYTRPVGEHLKYLVWSHGVPVACLTWSSAPRHIGCRDRFIGWSAETRRQNVHLLAYNTRFLILPWPRSRIWPPTSWGQSRGESRRTGRRCITIRSGCWRPSLTRSAFVARAIGPPTGSIKVTTGRVARMTRR